MSDDNQPQPPIPPKKPRKTKQSTKAAKSTKITSTEASTQPTELASVQPAAPSVSPVQKKGLSPSVLWSIIGGAVALVILIVTIIVVAVFFSGPSQKDFQEARKWISADSRTTSSLRSVTDPDDYKEKLDDMLESRNELHQKLSSSPIMRDSEVKEAYDKYIKEYDLIKPELESMAKYIDDVSDYYETCRRTSYISYVNKTSAEVEKEFDSKYSSCLNTLTKLSKADNEAIASYAKSWLEYYDSLKKYYSAIAQRYSNRDYSSSMPSYPRMPSSSISSAIFTKISDSETDDYYRDFVAIVNRKSVKID